jgi:hypothetical protein
MARLIGGGLCAIGGDALSVGDFGIVGSIVLGIDDRQEEPWVPAAPRTNS